MEKISSIQPATDIPPALSNLFLLMLLLRKFAVQRDKVSDQQFCITRSNGWTIFAAAADNVELRRCAIQLDISLCAYQMHLALTFSICRVSYCRTRRRLVSSKKTFLITSGDFWSQRYGEMEARIGYEQLCYYDPDRRMTAFAKSPGMNTQVLSNHRTRPATSIVRLRNT